MKLKTTKKQLQQNYYYIVRGGYCEFATLLKNYADEFGYSCGVYGWNWDAYEIEATNGQKICICTGYRDMTGKRVSGLARFEEKAKKLHSWENLTPLEQKQKQHKKLLKQFADYIIENYNNN